MGRGGGGKQNKGNKMENMYNRGGGGERWNRRTPKDFTPNSSSGANVPVWTGPAFCSNSNSTHSQTEINRILRYTKLSIKIFVQMIAAWRGKLQDAANVQNLPNEAEITGLESAERRH